MARLVGGALALPSAARAQLKALPAVGFLHAASPATGRLAAFRTGLSERGTAKALGLGIPQSLLLRADSVIE